MCCGLISAECTCECGDLHLVRHPGGFEEASRRRKEADLSRAQLQQKIESLKQARNSTPRTGACLTRPTPPVEPHCRHAVRPSVRSARLENALRKDETSRNTLPSRTRPLKAEAYKASVSADEGAVRPKSASSQRAKAEAAHRKVMARREAESTVRASYFRFAGNGDVAAFMRALGYDMPASKDASPPALFHAAVQVRTRSLSAYWASGMVLKDLIRPSRCRKSIPMACTAIRLLCCMSWRSLPEYAQAGRHCEGVLTC